MSFERARGIVVDRHAVTAGFWRRRILEINIQR